MDIASSLPRRGPVEERVVHERLRVRVSLGDEDSDTYFQATLDDDASEYVGTWHYPAGGPPDSEEKIVYTRVRDDR